MLSSRLTFVLSTVLLFLPFLMAQDACQALYAGNEVACLKNTSCTYCKCAAVPSSCFTNADSRKLPPSVFQCGNATSTDCTKATTNATCAKNVGCSWCTIATTTEHSLSNLRTSSTVSSSCVNFVTASKLPSGSCTGPY